MHSQVALLNKKIAPMRAQLLAHPVYSKINNLEGLKNFVQFHVFAVWDFMSLLKSLQIGLTSVQLPWVPVGTANTRYLINEIVLGEESDVDEVGNRISHFELYIRAMQQMGASTSIINQLITEINNGASVIHAIESMSAPKQVKDFLQFYEPVGPELQGYSVLWTGDPTGGNLDLRESGEHTHFHSYTKENVAGHYHFDVTPNDIEYEGYFNIAKEVHRVNNIYKELRDKN